MRLIVCLLHLGVHLLLKGGRARTLQPLRPSTGSRRLGDRQRHNRVKRQRPCSEMPYQTTTTTRPFGENTLSKMIKIIGRLIMYNNGGTIAKAGTIAHGKSMLHLSVDAQRANDHLPREPLQVGEPLRVLGIRKGTERAREGQLLAEPRRLKITGAFR